MDAYARGGAHLEAIKAAKLNNYFSESMFVRFVPYDAQGVWLERAYG
jgi:spheroidene monooxygenase